MDGQVTREFPGRRVRVVASFSKDKEITKCLAIILRHSGSDRIHFAEVRNEIVLFFFLLLFLTIITSTWYTSRLHRTQCTQDKNGEYECAWGACMRMRLCVRACACSLQGTGVVLKQR